MTNIALTAGDWEDIAATTALNEGEAAQESAQAAWEAGNGLGVLRGTRAAIAAKSAGLLAQRADHNGNRLNR